MICILITVTLNKTNELIELYLQTSKVDIDSWFDINWS